MSNSLYAVCIRTVSSNHLQPISLSYDVQSVINQFRAHMLSNPKCAWNLFPDDYEIVYWEIGGDVKPASSIPFSQFKVADHE